MGLLDDAIREHLELKRRRGADPGAVAREERDALEPLFEQEPAPDAEAAGPHEAPEVDEPFAEDEHVPPAAPATLGQETAELDMAAVLEADLHEGHQGDPIAHQALHAPAHEPAQGDSLEWEMPGDHQERPPEQIPGQERLSFE
jgi:hypothetical protein